MRAFADHICRIPGNQREGQLSPFHLNQRRFRMHFLTFTGRTNMCHVHFSTDSSRPFGEFSLLRPTLPAFSLNATKAGVANTGKSPDHRQCEIIRLHDSPADMFQSFFQHSHFIFNRSTFCYSFTESNESGAKNNEFVF